MSSLTTAATQRAEAVLARVREACRASGRTPDSVKIIAVSKTRPAPDIRAAHAAGLTRFGENYLQEALPKIDALRDLDADWHYIGRIQANKCRDIAGAFDWVHTVDRARVARRLSAAREGAPLNTLIQVNVDNDPAKGGVPIDDRAALDELIGCIVDLPGLELRGCMTILAQDTHPADGFTRLKRCFEAIAPAGTHRWDTLSMGMSADFETAIACGATHVRIGTSIFGPREQNQ